MNTLSKVFVVVNLVFAVAFCFVTVALYAKKVNWRDRYEQTVQERDSIKVDFTERVSALETKNNDLDRRLTEALGECGRLEATNKEFNDQMGVLQGRVEELTTDNRLLVGTGEAKDQELRRRHRQIDRMHQIILTQQRAVEIAKENLKVEEQRRIEMENELNNSRSQLVAVQKEKSRLERDLHHNTYIIQTLMDKGVPVAALAFGTEGAPAQPIRGQVLAVKPEVNLVMLSVGEEAGVKRGHRFTVYRNDQYVGRVEVEKVYSDMCSARILLVYTKSADNIKEGDSAATRVY